MSLKRKATAIAFERWEALKLQVKEIYTEIDELESLLIDSVDLGDEVKLPKGRIGRIVDNFTNKNGDQVNKVFRPAAVKRFEPEILDA